ncbi:MAG: DUF4412 domain-containing protein [candidate division WOR-3 bacterium]
MGKILVLVLICSNIFADVMYEMETSSEGYMGMGEDTILVRTFVKGDRMRTEIKTKNSLLGEMEQCIITRLDRGVAWILDKDRKEFSEIPLSADSGLSVSEEIGDSMPEIKIEKTDETKQILDILCEKYILMMKINSDNEDLEIKQIMWLGKDFCGYDEIMMFKQKMLSSIAEPTIVGFNGKSIQELRKKISDFDGFPMEIEINLTMQNQGLNMAFKTTSVVKKITTVPISDRVFEIPENYKPSASQRSE